MATKALCDRVNASGKMWVTSTVLDKKVAIRMCTAGGTTEREHVRAAYDLFVKHAEELLSQGVPNGVRQAV